MRSLKKMSNELIRNIDVYLAFLLGVIAVFIGTFGLSQAVVTDITAGLLATIAFGMLRDRRNTDKIRKLVERIGSKIPDFSVISMERNLDQETTWVATKAESEILILLRTGHLLRTHASEISNMVRKNCRLKIILCAESEENIAALAYRGYSMRKKDDFLNDLHMTYSFLTNLNQDFSGRGSALIEIRTIDYMPQVSFFLTDPEEADAQAVIWLVGFRDDPRNGPKIRVEKNNNPELFSFFYEDFNRHWIAGNIVTLE